MVLIIQDFQDLFSCAVIKCIQFHVLFPSFALVIHFIACIATDRYCTISSARYRITNRNSNKLIAAIFIYVILTWLIVIWEQAYYDMLQYFESRCIVLQQKAASNKHPSSNTVIVVVSIWMHFSNHIIGFTTFLSVRFIRKAAKTAAMRFGRHVRRMETKRVIATISFNFCFIIFWIPFGVIAGQSTNMDVKKYVLLQFCCRILAYASFLPLPIIYYFMDKRFANHVKRYLKLCRRNQVAVWNAMHF